MSLTLDMRIKNINTSNKSKLILYLYNKMDNYKSIRILYESIKREELNLIGEYSIALSLRSLNMDDALAFINEMDDFDYEMVIDSFSKDEGYLDIDGLLCLLSGDVIGDYDYVKRLYRKVFLKNIALSNRELFYKITKSRLDKIDTEYMYYVMDILFDEAYVKGCENEEDNLRKEVDTYEVVYDYIRYSISFNTFESVMTSYVKCLDETELTINESKWKELLETLLTKKSSDEKMMTKINSALKSIMISLYYMNINDKLKFIIISTLESVLDENDLKELSDYYKNTIVGDKKLRKE